MRFFTTIKKKERAEGFTLVELLVAMSVFLVVVTVAVAVFVSALKGERYLTEQMAVNNTMGLVLEQMTREIRTGYQFSAFGSPCGNGGSTGIAFFNSQDSSPTGGNATTTYAFIGSGIRREELGAADASKNTTAIITSSNVNVVRACFTVLVDNTTGTRTACNPPRVVITAEVASNTPTANAPSAFMETTASSRILPVEIKNDPYQCRTQ